MRESRSEHSVAGVMVATVKAVATSTATSNLVSTAAHDTDGSVWRHGALVVLIVEKHPEKVPSPEAP